MDLYSSTAIIFNPSNSAFAFNPFLIQLFGGFGGSQAFSEGMEVRPFTLNVRAASGSPGRSSHSSINPLWGHVAAGAYPAQVSQSRKIFLPSVHIHV